MTSYSKGNISATFTHDADGLRGSKTVNGAKTTYFYVGDKLYYQHTANADGTTNYELYFYYDSYGNLSAIKYYLHSGTTVNEYTYYVSTNASGDVLGLYGGDGILRVSYEYDAWGNVTSVSDAAGNEITNLNSIAHRNPIRYRGYYYDNDLGLYYLQSRYYDATIGRFINADGTLNGNGDILGFNMFAYCSNNPVNRFDQSGMSWQDVKNFFSDTWSSFKKWIKGDNQSSNTESSNVEPVGTYNNGKSNVYIVKTEQTGDNLDNKEDTVVIIDRRTTDDPNMQIKDSYKITNTTHQREIAQIMINYNTNDPVEPAWIRTQDSIVEEWKLHNLAYNMGYKQDRTGDCDFNNADEGMGFWDFVGR